MRVTVRFFAGLRDLAGIRETDFDVQEGATLAQLMPCVVTRFPGLDGQQEAWHYAVNFTHVDHDTRLNEGDRVTIFPYIAGG